MTKSCWLVLAISLASIATSGRADVAVTEGINTAVMHYDRIATFDSVVSGQTDLRSYEEDGLAFFADGVAFNNVEYGTTGGYFYPNAGSHTYTSIHPTDDRSMTAVEFNAAGAGEGGLTHIYWEAYRSGMRRDSGTISIQYGDFVGFSDPIGFTELRVGAYFYLATIETMNSFDVEEACSALGAACWVNRLAIDTVRVVTPEPGAAPAQILAIGAVATIGRRRRRRR
jgi:hypothetical protein